MSATWEEHSGDTQESRGWPSKGGPGLVLKVTEARMTELAKKAPTLLAILALAYIGRGLLEQGIDSTLVGAVLVGIAGLGGFYLHEFVRRRNGK